MFRYNLSNGGYVVSVYPCSIVEYQDWNTFVEAEAEQASAKAALEAEWEAYLASHPSLPESEYYGSAQHQAYKAYQNALRAFPTLCFVGEEPLPQGPIQGFVPIGDRRVHAAYGGWDLREYWTHSAVRLAKADDLKVYSEKEAWRISAAAFPKGSYMFNGDPCGTHVEYRELTGYRVN